MAADEHRRTAYSIVLPAFNEGAGLVAALDQVWQAMEGVGDAYEVLVVDDGSTDGTWGILEEQSRRDARLRALRLSRNFGKEAALCAGLEHARGDLCIVMDADLQHPPGAIRDMIRLRRETGANIVEGVRTIAGEQAGAGSRLFYSLLRWLSGHDLRGASDFKLIDRSVRDAWLRMGERNLFFRGMIAWLGFHRVRMPFSVAKRASGESRWSFLGLVRLALTALTGFSSLPLRLVTVLGSAFFVFGLWLAGDTLANKISGRAATGFTTVILLQLIIAGVLMLCLGIIGEYIARIYDEVKHRPRYIVAGMVGDGGAGDAAPRDEERGHRPA